MPRTSAPSHSRLRTAMENVQQRPRTVQQRIGCSRTAAPTYISAARQVHTYTPAAPAARRGEPHNDLVCSPSSRSAPLSRASGCPRPAAVAHRSGSPRSCPESRWAAAQSTACAPSAVRVEIAPQVQHSSAHHAALRAASTAALITWLTSPASLHVRDSPTSSQPLGEPDTVGSRLQHRSTSAMPHQQPAAG